MPYAFRSAVGAAALAALLAPAGPAAAQDGLTVTGLGAPRSVAAAVLQSLSMDAVRLAARDVGHADVRQVGGDRLVVLVRHAEKADEPRADPPLTAAGRARAAALAALTEAAGIGSVIVTPFARTRETAGPVAAARGLTPIEVPVGGGLAAHVAAVTAAVRGRPAGEAVLVVGHSNTIPAIVTALGGPKLADLCDSQYAVLYVMTVPDSGPARLVTASYGTPDAPDAGCPAMR